MAGPTCTILLPRPLTKDERRAILAKFFAAVGDRWWDGLSFWVVTTEPIGGLYRGEPRPFVIGFHPINEDDPADLIADIFGFKPEVKLEVGAMCKQPVDHRILAEVAVWFADSLGGAIYPGDDLPLPSDHPGTYMAVPPVIDLGVEWGGQGHILDVKALRAWLENPNFSM